VGVWVDRLADGITHNDIANIRFLFCCLNGKRPPDAWLAVRHTLSGCLTVGEEARRRL
jgi:hypothetical protein